MEHRKMTYREIKAIEEKNKQRILAICPNADEESGIYAFVRQEGAFKYAYVGQAKHLLTRMAQHLTGYQHIDLSIKKHGLYDSEKNPSGWRVLFIKFPEEQLDVAERSYIESFANNGFQMRNKTIGGQNEGKTGLAENKPSKGYHDGLKQGYENARKEIKHLFDLHLNAVIKSNKPNKTQEKALNKFREFIGDISEEDDEV